MTIRSCNVRSLCAVLALTAGTALCAAQEKPREKPEQPVKQHESQPRKATTPAQEVPKKDPRTAEQPGKKLEASDSKKDAQNKLPASFAGLTVHTTGGATWGAGPSHGGPVVCTWGDPPTAANGNVFPAVAFDGLESMADINGVSVEGPTMSEPTGYTLGVMGAMRENGAAEVLATVTCAAKAGGDAQDWKKGAQTFRADFSPLGATSYEVIVWKKGEEVFRGTSSTVPTITHSPMTSAGEGKDRGNAPAMKTNGAPTTQGAQIPNIDIIVKKEPGGKPTVARVDLGGERSIDVSAAGGGSVTGDEVVVVATTTSADPHHISGVRVTGSRAGGVTLTGIHPLAGPQAAAINKSKSNIRNGTEEKPKAPASGK